MMTSRNRRSRGMPPLRDGQSPLPKRTRFTKPMAPAVPLAETFSEPKPMPRVGNTFTQHCPYIGCDFVYEITKVIAPNKIECKIVGVKER